MKKNSRRSFLKGVVGAGAGVVFSSFVSFKNAVAEKLKERREKDVGMLYDATKCIGCKACEVACKDANNMPIEYDENQLWDAPRDLSSKTLTIIKLYKGENGEESFIKRQCMHCVDPVCVSGCPTSALKKLENGVVAWDKDACCGCRYCQMGCPFSIPKYEFDAAYGKIVKCEMCSNNGLLAAGKTACSEACPTGALIFGKQKKLLKIARHRLHKHPEKYNGKIFGEFDSGGTGVIYLASVSFEKLGFPHLPEYSSARISEGIQHTIYHNMIAPIIVYCGLALIAFKNLRMGKKEEE